MAKEEEKITMDGTIIELRIAGPQRKSSGDCLPKAQVPAKPQGHV
jgi:hypothetical protein